MSVKIIIQVAGIELPAELYETETARAVAEALPITGKVNRWGEEIYFEIPVKMPLAPDAREEVEVGELGYWPPGRAFCIFFGKTPASADDKPKAASPVNIIGRVIGDAKKLSAAKDGDEIMIKSAE